MNDTVNAQEATTTTAAAENTAEQKTFTQAELDSIVKDRLTRDRAKYEGFEDLKKKAAKFDEMEEANKTELQKMSEKALALENELNSMKKAAEIQAIRDEVAKETGVPASLLTGDTKDACTAQAEAIKEFAHPKDYPSVKDGGEINRLTNKTAKDSFSQWASAVL